MLFKRMTQQETKEWMLRFLVSVMHDDQEYVIELAASLLPDHDGSYIYFNLG